MGIDNMHHTTVAKIEAGAREVKLDEAAAMADLYGLPLDALLGRSAKGARDLHDLLGALMDEVFTARTQMHRTGNAMRDRLDDIPSEFTGYDRLAELGRELSTHMDAARGVLETLEEQLISDMESGVAQQVFKQLKAKRDKGQT